MRMMRHRFHSLCPYFAMFPEEFVQRHLAWSKPDDLVLDPFCGRGTTIFESLLRGRNAIGCDTNPVAVCVSRAKADPPKLRAVLERIAELETRSKRALRITAPTEFFRWCFHAETFHQVAFLRDELEWRRRRDDCFIGAMALGLLHGESHRTGLCFSNRMPRTISTKPDYSVRWWRERNSRPPKRDAFEILREMTAYRFASDPADRRGLIKNCDVRRASSRFPNARGQVKLVITSPPYLDTTNYREDQWLRLWFLGGDTVPETGNTKNDDRHRGPETYWRFLEEAWRGITPLLADGAHLIVRIGGRRVERDDCERNLLESMRVGFDTRIKLLDRKTSTIRKRQAVAFHPEPLDKAVEHDFHLRVA
jgi:DNA modification methylase